jgi:HSP20 family protein
MNEFARSVSNAVVKRVGRLAGRFQEQRPLSSDLLESDDEYLVVFDVPGATTSDVAVRYQDGAVRVTVDRFREYHEGYSMRFPGRGLALEGKRRLPRDAVVDATEGRATLSEDGTLSVFIPKQAGTSVAVEAEGDEEEAQPEDTG